MAKTISISTWHLNKGEVTAVPKLSGAPLPLRKKSNITEFG
jgi:hypothetical protein